MTKDVKQAGSLETAPINGGLSRRDVMRSAGLAGLALPAAGGVAGLTSLVLSGGEARAATAGQCVFG